MLEYSKNNAYNRFQGPAGRVPSAPLQKRTNGTLFIIIIIILLLLLFFVLIDQFYLQLKKQ